MATGLAVSTRRHGEALIGMMSETAKEQIERLAARVDYRFRDHELLREALTHSSFANEHPQDITNNERLEFLGDAVLDLVVGALLYEEFPSCHEGEMTRMRAEVVAEPSLASLARQLQLGELLLLGRGERLGGGRDKSSLLADAFEAVVGAIFKDGGYTAVVAVVKPYLLPLLQQSQTATSIDSKSRLQELLQSRQQPLPRYRLVSASGPDHDKSYLVEALVDENVLGCGEGRTKKAAEQAAASVALKELE